MSAEGRPLEPATAPTLRFVLGTGAYALVLLVLGVWCAGFGHGMFFPLRIFFAPVSGLLGYVDNATLGLGVLILGALAWPSFVMILRFVKPQPRKSMGRIVLLVHYFSAIGLVVIAAVSGLENPEALSNRPAVVFALLCVGVYAIGQVVIWRVVNRL